MREVHDWKIKLSTNYNAQFIDIEETPVPEQQNHTYMTTWLLAILGIIMYTYAEIIKGR